MKNQDRTPKPNPNPNPKPDDDDNTVHPAPTDSAAGTDPTTTHIEADHDSGDDAFADHTRYPAAWALVGMSAALGIIGLSIGFATVLGLTATASGTRVDGSAADTSGFGPMIVSAAASLILGILLIAGAALLWRARRASVLVISAAVTLLALSSLVRLVFDSITFLSVIGTVLSFLALGVMGYLITSDGVREHVREGVPLRLR